MTLISKKYEMFSKLLVEQVTLIPFKGFVMLMTEALAFVQIPDVDVFDCSILMKLRRKGPKCSASLKDEVTTVPYSSLIHVTVFSGTAQ